jgi:hypothetical protein
MLWMKGWYETRTKLLVLVGATALIAVVASSDSDPATASISAQGLDATTLVAASVLAAIMLAGAGIKTQPAGFRPSKGLHGSMYYTLSLPVTRSRLLGVRATIGLAEMAVMHIIVCGTAWLVQPAIRLNVSGWDMFKHGVAAFFCVGALYGLGVFFATFLDDFYQTLASMLSLWAFIVIINRVPLPPSFNCLLVLSQASPLITHTMPWTGMGALLALSSLLLLLSVWIVQQREY